jgi:hypothetical protein
LKNPSQNRLGGVAQGVQSVGRVKTPLPQKKKKKEK